MICTEKCVILNVYIVTDALQFEILFVSLLFLHKYNIERS